jgi:hypothetical protein
MKSTPAQPPPSTESFYELRRRLSALKAAEPRTGGMPAGPAPAGAGARPLLDLNQKKIKEQNKEGEYEGPDGVLERSQVASPCRCGVRTCNDCGRFLGWYARQALLGVADVFKRPKVLTLTVDRSRFAGPREAHSRISGGKYVRRLMRALGITRWVWVLEFQMKTGDGWSGGRVELGSPHWHLLIDVGDLPARGKVPNYLDLPKAWKLWRDKWGLGGLDLAEKGKDMTPAHAINYLTKYLIKQPEGGYPEWVLKTHSIRFLQGCRELPPLVARFNKSRAPKDPDEPTRPTTARRPLVVRMSECAEQTRVFVVDPDARSIYAGNLPASPAQLLSWAQNEDWLEGAVEERDINGKPSIALNWSPAEIRHAIDANKPTWPARREERRQARVDAILGTNARRQKAVEEPNRACYRLPHGSDGQGQEDHQRLRGGGAGEAAQPRGEVEEDEPF